MPFSATDWLAYAGIMLLPVAVIAYLCGCFNGAVIVSKFILHNDIRDHGSGNAGLTNFHRVFGGPLTFAVILCDVLKMIVAVLIARAWLGGTPFATYWGGFFCLLGHAYPATFKFRGGKCVLSGGTLAWMIDWRVALVVWGGFLILAVATRYVSLGSCWAGVTFPIASWFVYRNGLILLLAIGCGGMLLWKHRGNIKRLVTGTESKFTLRKDKGGEKP